MNQKSKEKTDVTKALFSSGNLSPVTSAGLSRRPTSTRQDGGSNSIIIDAVDDDFFNLGKKNSKLRLSTREAPQEFAADTGVRTNRLSFSPVSNNRLCK